MRDADLSDTAVDICAVLDRVLVEKIWPAKRERQKKLQEKESARHKRTEVKENEKQGGSE